MNGWRSGLFSFDPLPRHVVAHADQATARSAAKNTEYPSAYLQLIGRLRP